MYQEEELSLADHIERYAYLPPCWVEELEAKQLPPVDFLVEGLLPEGVTLLSAPSKLGKSWMALDLALSICQGQPFFSRPVKRTGVLYMALEDSENRLQQRLRILQNGRPCTGVLGFHTKVPTMEEGLLEYLESFLAVNSGVKFIIVDTLQKIRGLPNGREMAYAQDYREMGKLKDFVHNRHIGLLLIHHNRKSQDPEDPFNNISGTTGIMGAADTIWTITRSRRNESQAVLHITGRDVEQQELAIDFNKDRKRWSLLGDARQLERQEQDAAYRQDPVVRVVQKLLEPTGTWEGTCGQLMEEGLRILGRPMAVNAQRLAYRIKELEEQLFQRDGISHSACPKTSRGSVHGFVRAGAFQKW